MKKKEIALVEQIAKGRLSKENERELMLADSAAYGSLKEKYLRLYSLADDMILTQLLYTDWYLNLYLSAGHEISKELSTFLLKRRDAEMLFLCAGRLKLSSDEERELLEFSYSLFCRYALWRPLKEPTEKLIRKKHSKLVGHLCLIGALS